MEAAHMTFKEEVIRLRRENKLLRIRTSQLERQNDTLNKKVALLEQENINLHTRNKQLEEQLNLALGRQELLEKQIESLNLIVEELRQMVFGKKKSSSGGGENQSGEDDSTSGQTGKRKSANRSKESYRRAAPKDKDVTETINHPLTNCPDCGTLLTNLKQIIRFVEDIADLTNLASLLKKIEKHIIGSGYCPSCKRRRTATDITPQVSILGENTKQFVCYLSIIMRLSFEQIRCFLTDTAGLNISDGEITTCLWEQSGKLKPEYDRLFAKIRGAPGRHYDETSWKVQKEGQGNYCWISRPTEGEEAVFLMGRSRGKGNAEELRGDVDNQIGISDDYPAYDNLFKNHQLCMGHPKRKLRDLHESKTLSPISRTNCNTTYGEFSKLYADLEETLSTEYEKDIWLQKREEYMNRLREIAILSDNDPQKLKTLKQSLKQNVKYYFTCLLQPGIPADNNKAERGLRHIVLKRKISYGSKSQKGADTMGILCSTLLSSWWNKPDNFFVAYRKMINN